MEVSPPTYRREFWKSPHHVWLALLTLGLGFVSAQELYLLIGAAAYALGWVYLPDLGFFRNWVDKRRDAERKKSELEELQKFLKRREAILDSLASHRRERYRTLVAVCRDIEKAGGENILLDPNAPFDPRLRRLDELMWTYLRLLSIEQSLDQFLELEQREALPQLLLEADREIAGLRAELEHLSGAGSAPLLEQRKRLLDSCLERRDVLTRRIQRLDQARANLALVLSEQERLDHQIKLLRADAIAARNAQGFMARIDATVEQLDQTNKWLAQMAEFRDLVGDLPATDLRVGYEAPKPPLLSSAPPAQTPGRIRGKIRQ